ncbi:MAG: hypothetical protein F6J90_20825 [Moorea sp. SIOASIH]|nr:hypothetical protein [Moorena sp. SIOASIH]
MGHFSEERTIHENKIIRLILPIASLPIAYFLLPLAYSPHPTPHTPHPTPSPCLFI